jgi:hypothetical protein
MRLEAPTPVVAESAWDLGGRNGGTIECFTGGIEDILKPQAAGSEVSILQAEIDVWADRIAGAGD